MQSWLWLYVIWPIVLAFRSTPQLHKTTTYAVLANFSIFFTLLKHVAKIDVLVDPDQGAL